MLPFSFKSIIISDLLDDTQGPMLSLCGLDKNEYLKTGPNVTLTPGNHNWMRGIALIMGEHGGESS